MTKTFSVWGSALVAGLMMSGAAGAADLSYPVKAPPPNLYAPTSWVNLFAGFAVDKSTYFGDVGAVFALNRNLDTNGWLVRVRGGAGHYEYNRTLALAQGVDFQVGELMLGYQWFVGASRFSAYLGANVEHHDNNDPFAVISGTRAGVKGQVELYSALTDRMYFYGLGTLSSAYTSYFAMAKLGYRVWDRVSIGPELAALGNTRYDAVRAGPFLAFDLTPSSQVIISGGYSWDTNRNWLNDNSGGYATIHLRGNF